MLVSTSKKLYHVCWSRRPKNSIEIAFFDAVRHGEVRSYGKIDGNLSALDKVIRRLFQSSYSGHSNRTI